MIIICPFFKIERRISYKNMGEIKTVQLLLLNILNNKMKSRRKDCMNFLRRELRNGVNKRKELTLLRLRSLKNAQASSNGQITHSGDRQSHLSEVHPKNG
jgi:hypothetical protein